MKKRQDEERVTKAVTDWDELYPGRFLKAGQFKNKPVTLKVASVYAEKMPDKDGSNRFKGVISFEKTDMELALNKTNGICIREMFGREVQTWVGKRITFYPAPYEGDIAIRVYGSPDIPKDIEVLVDLPRKKPFKMLLHKVENGAKAKVQEPVEAEPGSFDGDEEPPPDIGEES